MVAGDQISDETLYLYIAEYEGDTDPPPLEFRTIFEEEYDLTLLFQGNLAGDYEERVSWADAAGDDMGVCGGAVDNNPDTTCGDPCSDAVDCDAGEECVQFLDRKLCAPPGCLQCFDVRATCSWSTDDCSEATCEVDPNASLTCVEPCETVEDCSGTEICADTTGGSVCAPSACQACWDDELTCTPDDSSCTTVTCS